MASHISRTKFKFFCLFVFLSYGREKRESEVWREIKINDMIKDIFFNTKIYVVRKI